mgnify:CR=1 FL=1
MKKLTNKKGFTLMELIIAIAILGAVSLIAVPSMSGIQHRTQIDADKLTGSQIGQAFLIMQSDIGEVKIGGVKKYRPISASGI